MEVTTDDPFIQCLFLLARGSSTYLPQNLNLSTVTVTVKKHSAKGSSPVCPLGSVPTAFALTSVTPNGNGMPDDTSAVDEESGRGKIKRYLKVEK